MVLKKIIPLLLVFSIAAALLNSNAFGSASLIAYFFYCILASFTGILIFFKLLLNKNANYFKLPVYGILFLLFVLYILLHGIVTKQLGLTHYYWCINAIFFFSINAWANSTQNISNDKKYNNSVLFVFKGIALLAVIESIIVLLQFTTVLPVPNKFFNCTGTWGNPNVSAMFLAMSIFAILHAVNNATGKFVKKLFQVVLAITVLAIILLQCRSALLAAFIILIAEYNKSILQFYKKHVRLSTNGFALVMFTIVILMITIAMLTSKKASSGSRLQILKISTSLIAKQPIAGFGFGMFEKEYNLFAANQKNTVNDHINMAYNDFVELGIEGGLIATLLWLTFIVALLYFIHKKLNRKFFLLPTCIAFVVMQLTNFVFQAIPATILFLFYLAIVSSQQANNASKQQSYFSKISLKTSFALGLIVSILLFFKVNGLTGAFYNQWILDKNPTNANTLSSYKNLGSTLNGYASYHENYGDAFLNTKHYTNALEQYKTALQKSSNPNLFVKSAYCFQEMKMYDSSEYYYLTVQNMQPHKFIHRLGLLRLYEQKNDSAAAIAKAKEIVALPIKIRSKRVYEIKGYAAKVIDSLTRKN